MRFQFSCSRKELSSLARIHQLLRCFGSIPILAVMLGLVLFPDHSQATILLDYGLCNPSDGCDQSVNFTPANTGATVVGNTNPPKPWYQIFAASNVVLHGSGSTVDSGVGGSGFNLLTLTPEVGFYWSSIEFQLDSLNNDQPRGSDGLTLTAWDQFGNAYSFAADFPWEKNTGENQHYRLYSADTEAIAKLKISYKDPLDWGNAIQDIHNIDVNTIVFNSGAPIGEPPSLWLVGVSLIATAHFLSRDRRRHKP